MALLQEVFNLIAHGLECTILGNELALDLALCCKASAGLSQQAYRWGVLIPYDAMFQLIQWHSLTESSFLILALLEGNEPASTGIAIPLFHGLRRT